MSTSWVGSLWLWREEVGQLVVGPVVHGEDTLLAIQPARGRRAPLAKTERS
ncbi:hypothetical protein [Ornithinimicrobium sp. INDO-MA30-4]|uniref:hypothetical protein n=1 Tax=Ornithinimicrobium sp. INDO-MA30-4 TaxID=2908651 RepID=UPI001F2E91AB|nr:hypothetical protein [Ornithinimicrobium sp. INDO-MA30-4]UJH70296.1 hypothetical protein L0A91_14305 [Ornithinimicrobium sp. INDO-MA30-4]